MTCIYFKSWEKSLGNPIVSKPAENLMDFEMAVTSGDIRVDNVSYFFKRYCFKCSLCEIKNLTDLKIEKIFKKLILLKRTNK